MPIVSSTNLKSAGLKATLPRLTILELFQESAQRHLSAEDVYRLLINHDGEIGLATVYRVLTQFEQAGLLIRRQFEGGKAVFEMNEGAHHDHMICLMCGRVDEFVDDLIERRQRAIAKQRGFELSEHAMALYGKCLACQKSER